MLCEDMRGCAMMCGNVQGSAKLLQMCRDMRAHAKNAARTRRNLRKRREDVTKRVGLWLEQDARQAQHDLRPHWRRSPSPLSSRPPRNFAHRLSFSR
eukprot:1690384-Rhodomonas_salina.1